MACIHICALQEAVFLPIYCTFRRSLFSCQTSRQQCHGSIWGSSENAGSILKLGVWEKGNYEWTGQRPALGLVLAGRHLMCGLFTDTSHHQLKQILQGTPPLHTIKKCNGGQHDRKLWSVLSTSAHPIALLMLTCILFFLILTLDRESHLCWKAHYMSRTAAITEVALLVVSKNSHPILLKKTFRGILLDWWTAQKNLSTQ